MGCCGNNYPRNEEVEAAKTREDLINAIKNVIKKNDEETQEINDFITNGTALTTEQLKDFSKEQLEERSKYLQKLNNSYGEVIDTISNCTNELPMADAKELVQNCLQHYYVCYDETNLFAKDANEFKKFALKYDKSNQN